MNSILKLPFQGMLLVSGIENTLDFVVSGFKGVAEYVVGKDS